jgi:hypothetical protein
MPQAGATGTQELSLPLLGAFRLVSEDSSTVVIEHWLLSVVPVLTL